MKKSSSRFRLFRGTAFAALCIGAAGFWGSPASAQTVAPVQNKSGQTEPSQQQQISAQQGRKPSENSSTQTDQSTTSSQQSSSGTSQGASKQDQSAPGQSDQNQSSQDQSAQQNASPQETQQNETQQSQTQQSQTQQSQTQEGGNKQSQNQQTEGGLAQASSEGKERGQTPPVGVNVSVTDRMMRHAGQDQDNWLLYGRTYDNQRFSPLRQINTETIRNLAPAAIIQTGVAATFEDSPIEVNGILYIITANDHVQAYDATTGRILWSYDPKLQYSDLCCGPEARGVAVGYGHVYVAQLDARLVALDARTGKVEWKTDPAKTLPHPTQYSFTLAPQIYDGMVIVGSAGAEYPTRGFVEAFDAKTGKPVWTFRTIAAPGQPGGNTWSGDSWKTGGGSVWNTPAVDPKNGLILFAVGNPNPDNWGESRKGDNAYTDSIVALHAKTGKIAWWYQEVKHDVWDYDAAGPVVLFKAKDHGKEVPAAAQAGKVGNVFIVNRLNGKLIRESEPFVMQSANMWTPPGSKPIDIYPAANGGGMWSPSAYSPQTHDFYVLGDNEAWTYTAEAPPKADPNVPQVGMKLGGELKPVISQHPKNTISPSGTFTAIDVDTGQVAWQYKSPLPMQGGALATAGNLVFTGEMNGDFDAFNARTGQRLWHFNLGVGANAPPITYRVNGVQYVAIAAGGNGNNGNPELMTELGRPQYGDTVAIFAIPGPMRTASNQAGAENAAYDEDNGQAENVSDQADNASDQSGNASDQADNASGSAKEDEGSASITGSAGTAGDAQGTGGASQSQTEPGKVTAGQPPGATKNQGVSNTANGHQSGSGNQSEESGGDQGGGNQSGTK